MIKIGIGKVTPSNDETYRPMRQASPRLQCPGDGRFMVGDRLGPKNKKAFYLTVS